MLFPICCKIPCCSTPPSVAIDIKDSCNSKCGFCKPRPETKVYVNSRGHAELYSTHKASNEREAMKRSIINLQKKVDELIMANNAQEKAEDIKGRVNSIVPEDSPIMTVKMLDNINTILTNALEKDA